MTREMDEEVYVARRPVLLTRKPVKNSKWDDFATAMEGSWRYIVVTLGVAALCVLAVYFVPTDTGSKIFGYLASASAGGALAILLYIWRKQQKLDDGRWFHRFGRTLRNAGPYCLCGVVAAVLLWRIAAWAQPDEHMKEILTHIAGAFLVSAMVIFGYEWGSEAKQNADRAAALINVMHNHTERILEASAQNALVNALEQLIGPQAKDLSPQLQKFASALEKLGKSNDWVARGYLPFVAHYHEALTDNVREFAAFTGRTGGEPFEIKFAKAAAIADAMVSGTMHELSSRGGDYYALSDLSTWKELPIFRHAQAVPKVKIQRLFVLGKQADLDLKIKEIAEYLVEHYLTARASNGNYEMRLTDTTSRLAEKITSLSGAEHFGIFAPKDETAIVFSVHDMSMSDFRLRAAPESMINEFKNVFAQGTDLYLTEEPTKGNQVLRDYLLAYSIGRMGEGSTYRGVSKITTWEDGLFERFVKASINALNSRQITMQRLLVVDKEDLENAQKLTPFLQRHADICGKTDYKYNWRVSTMDDWPPSIAAEIAFGLFTERDSDDRVVADVALEHLPFVKSVESARYDVYAREFEKVWNARKSRRESIEQVFATNTAAVIAKEVPHLDEGRS